MTLMEKIKLLWKSAKPAGAFVEQIKGARLKYKTIPFWISFLGASSALVASLEGVIPATAGVAITSTLGIFYNILRGLDKTGQVGIKPPLLSTEFYIGALTIISNGVLQMQQAGINNKAFLAIQTAIAAAMAIAQNIGATQPVPGTTTATVADAKK